MDLETSLISLVKGKYPDITHQIAAPLSSHYLQDNLLKGWYIFDQIHNPNMFLNEPVYLTTYQLIKDLIKRNYDVWFVTMPNGEYSYNMCTSQKIAQIQRLFGSKMAKKVLFSSKKYDVKGKYLIDDNKNYILDMNKATWTQLMVNWRYNQDVEYSERVSLESIKEDVQQILNISD